MSVTWPDVIVLTSDSDHDSVVQTSGSVVENTGVVTLVIFYSAVDGQGPLPLLILNVQHNTAQRKLYKGIRLKMPQRMLASKFSQTCDIKWTQDSNEIAEAKTE